MKHDRVVLFRVVSDDDRTRIDTDGDVLGWGIRFPNDYCYLLWNREAFPPEHRLSNDHVSFYISLDDVMQGTGGTVERIHEQKVRV